MHLTDMEELLASIPREDSRDYMSEAVACYNVGAYRGAIVLSVAALSHDVMLQLSELARVNSDAKEIHDAALKKKDDQDVYETFMLEQAVAKHLIAALDKELIDILRRLRNKSAHPSGHRPSAEESRYVIRETITRGLARGVLKTTVLVDELIGRLENENLFPSPSLDHLKIVVGAEIEGLDLSAMPYLVSKLVSALGSPSKVSRKNAIRLLSGLCKVGKPEIIAALQGQFVAKKAESLDFDEPIIIAVSLCGRLAVEASDLVVDRLKATMRRLIDAYPFSSSDSSPTHPTRVLASVAQACDAEEGFGKYSDIAVYLVQQRPACPLTLEFVHENRGLLTDYRDSLLRKIRSHLFEHSKEAVNFVVKNDSMLGEVLGGEWCLKYVLGISSAADHGTWAAMRVVKGAFDETPLLREKAISYVEGNAVAAEDVVASDYPSAASPEWFVRKRLTPPTIAEADGQCDLKDL